jgi:hypothetical protein
LSTFPDGVFQYGGEPVGGARFSSPWATSWFVDGTSGYDGFDGKAPDRAKLTVQAALTAAGRGDVIYVRPLDYDTDRSDVLKYSETLTVPYATEDLSLIGVANTNPGNPNYGVKLQRTTVDTTYCLTVNAPAFHIENVCVRSEGSLGGGIHFYGVGTSDYPTYAGSCGPTMNNVVLRGGKYSVRISGGYAAYIANCRFEGGSGQYSSLVLNGNDFPQRRIHVRDCYFGGFNGAAIAEAYIRVYSNTDLLIQRCVFGILPTGTAYINATGVNLGIIADCYFDNADAVLASAIIKGGLTAVSCFDEKGIIA